MSSSVFVYIYGSYYMAGLQAALAPPLGELAKICDF